MIMLTVSESLIVIHCLTLHPLTEAFKWCSQLQHILDTIHVNVDYDWNYNVCGTVGVEIFCLFGRLSREDIENKHIIDRIMERSNWFHFFIRNFGSILYKYDEYAEESEENDREVEVIIRSFAKGFEKFIQFDDKRVKQLKQMWTQKIEVMNAMFADTWDGIEIDIEGETKENCTLI